MSLWFSTFVSSLPFHFNEISIALMFYDDDLSDVNFLETDKLKPRARVKKIHVPLKIVENQKRTFTTGTSTL